MSDFFNFNAPAPSMGDINFSDNGTNQSKGKPQDKQKEIRIIKGSPKANKASVFIMTKTPDGTIMFQMAKQAGTTQDKNGRVLPKFDYTKKVYFTLSQQEAGSLIASIDKLLLMGKAEKVMLPHQTAKEPKNITFDLSVYDNKPQCGVSVYVSKDQTKNASIYLSEGELVILKENLKSQITL